METTNLGTGFSAIHLFPRPTYFPVPSAPFFQRTARAAGRKYVPKIPQQITVSHRFRLRGRSIEIKARGQQPNCLHVRWLPCLAKFSIGTFAVSLSSRSPRVNRTINRQSSNSLCLQSSKTPPFSLASTRRQVSLILITRTNRLP